LKVRRTKRKLAAAVLLALISGRLLLIPGEKRQRDAEVRAAYGEYCSCLRIDILSAPGAGAATRGLSRAIAVQLV
jgi:hypothetical protein